MAEVLRFEQAWEQSIEHESEDKNAHIILGNGFSIGAHPWDFNYGKLYEPNASEIKGHPTQSRTAL